MKKIGTIIAILFVSVLTYAGESLDSLFIQANETYSKGEFEEAYALYTSVQDQGFESPELYFNMGNAAFRSNKLGYSIVYYEKALKLDPSYDEAQKNLEFVSIYKEDQLDQVPEFFLKSWVRSLYKMFSLSTWSYLALTLFFLSLLGILIYVFARGLSFKKAGFFISLIFMLAFILSLSAAIHRNSDLKSPESAVIIAPSVIVKSSPSLSGTDLFILHEGSVISIDDAVGEWIEIKISDGRVGWIQIQEMLPI
ncbi:MAG: tetratricopeptide repeat protein [Bacteroidales bacterium]|jgi:tetratricopeptide (TPR) repeat protein|nr:tetratricopeptide repeat protein [Bacteroidales bacterium]